MTDIQQFVFGTDDLSASGDNTVIFRACTRIQVVEVGIHVSADLACNGTSTLICEFDVTSASLGVTATEVTAPTRGSASANVNGPTTNVTVQDGKVLSEKCDFTMEKGETLTCQMSGTPTSGTGFPYILYRCAGQAAKEAGEQRGGVAVE